MTSTSSIGTKDQQNRRRVIRQTVKRNTAWTSTGRKKKSHTVEINLDKWAVPQHQIEFEGDNYPYLKMALVDAYLNTL